MSFLSPFSQTSPLSTESLIRPSICEHPAQPSSYSYSKTISPSIHHSPTTSPATTHSPSSTHVHITTATPSTSDDLIIGQVTLGGKFKCLDKLCRDDEALLFNRHADFKRHHVNMHARRMTEYFCPEKGCSRSRCPINGRKGRSFKGRRDKMREHVKTVHGAEGKKSKSKRESGKGEVKE